MLFNHCNCFSEGAGLCNLFKNTWKYTANGVHSRTPSCRKQCSEHWGRAEKAECTTALREAVGNTSWLLQLPLHGFLFLFLVFGFFAVQFSSVLHSLVGAATAKAWEHQESKPEASMGIVGPLLEFWERCRSSWCAKDPKCVALIPCLSTWLEACWAPSWRISEAIWEWLAIGCWTPVF